MRRGDPGQRAFSQNTDLAAQMSRGIRRRATPAAAPEKGDIPQGARVAPEPPKTWAPNRHQRRGNDRPTASNHRDWVKSKACSLDLSKRPGHLSAGRRSGNVSS